MTVLRSDEEGRRAVLILFRYLKQSHRMNDHSVIHVIISCSPSRTVMVAHLLSYLGAAFREEVFHDVQLAGPGGAQERRSAVVVALLYRGARRMQQEPHLRRKCQCLCA